MNRIYSLTSQHATYAAAPSAQFLPEPGTPGASGLGNFETLVKQAVLVTRNLKSRPRKRTGPI
ncbi:proteophosphoglycan ppg4 [Moniliophthora roreri]|nr:proteophosphoglycan ppg4 [Moniliophthora roreri]